MTLLWMIILFAVVRPTYQVLYSCNSTAVCGCSANAASVTKIVGGEAAGTATWGWAVSISIDNAYLCGGSIISQLWIVTAAHCVTGYSANQITVYAGSNIRWSGTQSQIGSQVIQHPNYNPSTYVDDIALIKLSSPLDMTDPDVSSICLPSVSSTTLAAGEWPPANTTVNHFLISNPFQSLSIGCSSRMGYTE
jgi:secreted trypsin-like serine protease